MSALFLPRYEHCRCFVQVLLTDPATIDGGQFITYDAGSGLRQTVHELGQGDAVLFRSEDVHNVSPVLRGIRRSLVVERWTGPQTVTNRVC